MPKAAEAAECERTGDVCEVVETMLLCSKPFTTDQLLAYYLTYKGVASRCFEDFSVV